MTTLWIAYILAAVLACAAFVVANWRSRRMAARQVTSALPADPLMDDEEVDLAEEAARSDAAGAMRVALKRSAGVLNGRAVQVDLAAPPGLLVRLRVATLIEMLEEMLSAAAHACPTGRLLLTATARGDHVEIAIVDDMPAADPGLRVAAVRDLIERVALRGGTLDVRVRPDEGTTMTLRLVRAADRRSRDRDVGLEVATAAARPA